MMAVGTNARIADRRERHKGGAVGKGVTHPMCRMQRQTRLANASRPGQREQGDIVATQQLVHRGYFAFPPDQGDARDGKWQGTHWWNATPPSQPTAAEVRDHHHSATWFLIRY